MSLVYGDLSDPGVHVTVACVAQYDVDEFNADYLEGAVMSADRLIDFWLSGQLPAGETLASVSLFVSSPESMPSRYEESASPATFGAIEDHLQAMIELDADHARAIIHWIGHGAVVGADGGQVRGVFTSDGVSVKGKLEPRGIDVQAMLRAISRLTDLKVIITVDACATSHLDEDTNPFSNPVNVGERVGDPTNVLGLFAAAFPHDTICAGRQFEVEEGEWGGSLYSEAVRLSLAGFGATKFPGRPSTVFIDGLEAAVKHHHSRLRRQCDAAPPPTRPFGAGFSRNLEVSEPKMPKSAVLLVPKSGDVEAATRCRCKVSGAALAGGGVSAKWEDDEAFWEAHVPQSTSDEDIGYSACVSNSSREGARQKFGATIPLKHVYLDMPA